ncbi:hypothetical protein [uncultured Chryseobacterium sp.]|uniref:hypothetical protein n=1 Tax=uncultured Chryseobacterium sp. TaxID=259322 RepID=UPI00258D1006|nr:hypothetical protein [uncultured Chryseobacterium sp.]
MKKKIAHFKSQINYKPTVKGGLVSPISSGFRSEIKFPFELKSYIATQEFTETELIFPGDSASIDVTLNGADLFLDQLYEGMDFELCDNSGVIAEGIITELY